MTDEELQEIIENTVKTLPDEFREKLDNVAIILEDVPTMEQYRKAGVHPNRGLLFGLYEGIPRDRRGNYYGVRPTLPDRISIFRNPILYTSQTKEEVARKIYNVVLHEIAHHFGLNEKEVRAAERARRAR